MTRVKTTFNWLLALTVLACAASFVQNAVCPFIVNYPLPATVLGVCLGLVVLFWEF